jgi:hypothetical protein
MDMLFLPSSHPIFQSNRYFKDESPDGVLQRADQEGGKES